MGDWAQKCAAILISVYSMFFAVTFLSKQHNIEDVLCESQLLKKEAENTYNVKSQTELTPSKPWRTWNNDGRISDIVYTSKGWNHYIWRSDKYLYGQNKAAWQPHSSMAGCTVWWETECEMEMVSQTISNIFRWKQWVSFTKCAYAQICVWKLHTNIFLKISWFTKNFCSKKKKTQTHTHIWQK